MERADGRLALRWAIAPGYYLYRDHFSVTRGDEDVAFHASEGEMKVDPGFGTVEVLYEKAVLMVPMNGLDVIRLVYQGCQDDGICYRPETRYVDPASLDVSHDANGLGETGQAARADSSRLAVAGIVIAEDADAPSTILRTDNNFWVALSFLGFGVLLAFTPCVFPIYPIVLGMLGRQGETMNAGRGFLLSSTYVVSLAVAFALVGALVGWTGQNIQFALQSTLTTMAIAVVFLVLAAASFGWFELQLPGFVTNRLARSTGGRGSLGSAAALGFSSSLLVGPCVTAPLAGALVYIAQGGDWRVGALALFALGLGKGLPLIALATFGGRLMPRAGRWMEAVRRLFGFGFIVMAVWIAGPLLPQGIEPVLYVALALVAVADLSLRARALRTRTPASALALLGAGFVVGSLVEGEGHMQAEARISLQSPAASTLVFATVRTTDQLIGAFEAAEGKPVMVYVTAEWCTICRTIERSVFPEDSVSKALNGVHLVKLDVTDFDTNTQALQSELAVAGPPTILFFDGTRREVAVTRLIGSVSADSLVHAATSAGIRR
ncbi:MAG: protein-disulfide reductase DsbD [Mesorhizobium sp.]|nr:protein-disulfide reductase DsbD [Mesorhizobium sp.]